MGLKDSKISFHASSQCLGKGITSLCCPSGTHVFASRGGQCNEGLLPSIGKKIMSGCTGGSLPGSFAPFILLFFYIVRIFSYILRCEK